jgi:tetratricopeptide (TPR) repeat protein
MLGVPVVPKRRPMAMANIGSVAARQLVMRQDFSSALAAVEQGIAARARQVAEGPVLRLGLFWLRGLLLLRNGAIAQSIISFARELDELPDDGPEVGDVRRHAQIGAGFAHLAAGDPAGAIDAFRLALETPPRHGRALIGLQYAFRQTSLAAEADHLSAQIDRAIAAEQRLDEAVQCAAAAKLSRGDAEGAYATLTRFLAAAPAGLTGWTIPIDPALTSLRAHPEYPTLMALLAARAG